jgi:hypothetical protein
LLVLFCLGVLIFQVSTYFAVELEKRLDSSNEYLAAILFALFGIFLSCHSIITIVRKVNNVISNSNRWERHE